MAKGIPTRPVAKRINKLPLILFLSLLIVIVIACFYVVTERQKRLQSNAATGIDTVPINTDTQKPDFFKTAFLKELDEKTRLEKTKLEKEQTQQKALKLSGTKVPEFETKQVDQEALKQAATKKASQAEKPFQPYSQSQQPLVQPKKSEAQLFREKVATQQREAALKAQKASTLVSIGTASILPQQQTTSTGTSGTSRHYPQPSMTMPQHEKPDQAQKTDFLNTAEENKVSLANSYREALSPFELKQGHLIPMTLITKINSDLPGRIKAQVTENVYDTATGNFLLIPQGTMINGIYDSRVVFGQKRILIAWQRLIFPDASTLNVGSMPGTDREGAAGLKDLVDNHYFQIFGAAILASIVNAGFNMASDTGTILTDKETAQDSLTKAAAQEMQQTFSKMIDKIMNIQPELIIRHGKQGHIILTKDVIGLKPYNPADKPTYYLKTAKIE